MKAARLAGIVLAAAYVWSFLASGIWCVGTWQIDRFNPPFLQWWWVLPWWRVNWWVSFWFVFSAAVPSGLALIGVYQWVRRHRDQPLYGKTEWATPNEMDHGGFRQSRQL